MGQTLNPTLTELVREKIIAIRNKIEGQIIPAQGSKNSKVAAAIETPLDQQAATISIVEQAEALLMFDDVIIQRLGVEFPIPTKDKLPPHLINTEFNPFLAEPLLREGSLLLDRCLQERREHDELKTKLFEACIQLDELQRLNDITEKEEDFYKLSETIITETYNALKVESDFRSRKGDGTNNDNSLQGQLDLAVARASHGQATTNGNENTNWDYNHALAEVALRENDLIETIYAYRLEREKGPAIEQAKQSAIHQKARNEVARIVAIRRAIQIVKEGGAFNFFEQMKPLEDRFDNDLKAAYLRLKAAHEGFTYLYAGEYSLAFPTLNEQKLDFDNLVTWCQNTNTWLASFLDKQQQVTRSFSLKQLQSEQERNFKDGKDAGKWQFKLNEGHFYNSKFVRLRGFAIQVDSGHERGSWNIAITPPTKLRNEKEGKNLRQNVGRLFLGRVNETTYQVIPESAAPPKLYNASPIGQDIDGGEWTIEILGMSTDKIPASAINDMSIHLTVALV
jgi:hypothetical protein